MARRQKTDRTNWVTAINPDTGKPSTMTQKAFDGVYKEKGFELVDRDNVDEATPARRPRRIGGDAGDGEGSGQQTGSAADIASKLNLGGGNEKQSDNSGETAAGRQPAGRDRGSR